MQWLRVAIALSVGCLPGTALAGAWTPDRSHVLVISGVTLSRAARGFDGSGKPSEKLHFRKLFEQNWMEYGLTDAVTLFAAPEYVFAEVGSPGQNTARTHAVSAEGGVRILLLSRIGMLSIQGSFKTAGGFAMSNSPDNIYGRQYELRLLYGRSFHLFGNDGFFDVEGAKRWIKHHQPGPDEIAIDATLGWYARSATLLMLQNFNLFSTGAVLPPYRPYRLHKLELSVVEQLMAHWSLQFGVLYSPAGKNIVQEQELVTAVWYRF